MILIILKEILKCVFDFFLVMFSYLIPKDNDLYIFTSHNGDMFKGNPRYLYKYFIYKKKIVWMTNNKSLKYALDELKVNTAYTYSFKCVWYTLRAKYIFIDDNLKGPFSSGALVFLGKFNIIQTWHGTGFKNIALLDDNFTGIHRLFIWAVYKSFNTVLATAECDKEQFKQSFNIKNVIVTGLPRNDIFFNQNLSWINYKERFSLYSFNNVILYAPTYRERQNFSPFDIDFLHEMDGWLRESNTVMLIKKHPRDNYFEIDSSLSNIIDVTNRVDDVQELLICTDILITDYSSVATDFILTGRPMIFYVYDYSDYINNNRSLYRDMMDSVPGPFAYNQIELYLLLRDLSWFGNPDYQERYSKIRDMFHVYKDGKSSERIEKIICV